MFSTYRKYLNGWHICGNLLEFVDQQLEKWNNKTNRLYINKKEIKQSYKYKKKLNKNVMVNGITRIRSILAGIFKSSVINKS